MVFYKAVFKIISYANLYVSLYFLLSSTHSPAVYLTPDLFCAKSEAGAWPPSVARVLNK